MVDAPFKTAGLAFATVVAGLAPGAHSVAEAAEADADALEAAVRALPAAEPFAEPEVLDFDENDVPFA